MWKASDKLMATIKHYASFPATGVSLRQMVQFGETPSPGTLFRASQFLSEELPIRLAHRVEELNHLPDGLNEMPSIKKVKDWYAQSFEEIINVPKPSLSDEVKAHLIRPMRNHKKDSKPLSETTWNPSIREGQYRSSPDSAITANGKENRDPNHKGTNGNGKAKLTLSRRYFVPADDYADWPPEIDAYNQRFKRTLQQIKRRHDGVVTTVAQGILEYKRKRQRLQIDSSIQAFLDRFYMSRIGIRMLIGQHIALTEQTHAHHPNYVGIICTKTNIHEVATEAIENARFVCEDHYGLFEAPKVQLICKPDLNFMYVPGHLSHMLFETLKNSLRAVVETHGAEKEEFPVTKVIVAEGREDITIKISDEGGGIPRSSIPLVWTYMYTTVDQTPSLDPDFDKSDFKAPMAGFGYGLPISRLYARYFGGDLKLISMEGYGTDVYLHLNRLSSSSEPLH
ncbi:pyruvate dehydrogenase kinase [Talaromyces stipitatus ATCC 10500]|uniref:Protein-serine/threonine kinase n=1 Tax=Talaromyces stipitatus (strain ATCC 10500 / CBS 375.48 / QM 6759 / NRRL 1006) TaxID=441959 RepID=B8MIQ0_TALSN|nr:pyruvate dehydrogenase kinase [Talaromyces stipitatus ATCC 10500]EED15562.1 pyruvate dehydrogenase kinase [Talaromyces stipitatus ATCC 10500]